MSSNNDSTDFAFTSHGTALVGTLLLPEGPAPGPAALVLVGSGPVDRDSNVRRMRLDVTRAIAEALRSGGIGSLRYDKRGVGASGGDYHSAGLETMIEDARSALQALKRVPEVDPDRIVVIGHSEGALIAARLAATEAIAGAVLLSGSVMTGEQILQMQAGVAAASLPKIAGAIVKVLGIDIAKSQAKRIERLRRTTDDVVRIQGVRVNARWFREFLDHDPAVDLAQISVPLLASPGRRTSRFRRATSTGWASWSWARSRAAYSPG
jgi:alpha-beta hydrolase superfamily lysophospholipase